MMMNVVGFVFVILGIVASVIAFFLSEDGEYAWSAGIFLLSAMFWVIAGVFFFMGRRRVPVMPPPVMYPPR
jgi:predicted membrane channel-forming protein YqfA (hemolysin III family)